MTATNAKRQKHDLSIIFYVLLLVLCTILFTRCIITVLYLLNEKKRHLCENKNKYFLYSNRNVFLNNT